MGHRLCAVALPYYELVFREYCSRNQLTSASPSTLSEVEGVIEGRHSVVFMNNPGIPQRDTKEFTVF